MYRNKSNLEEEAYDPNHIALVLADMLINFPRYFSEFASDKQKLAERYELAISGFENVQIRYQELFNLDTLDDYTYNPSGFKSDLKKKAPIIKGALFAQTKAMDKYKAAFKETPGSRMLEITTNIVQFGRSFVKEFNWSEQLQTDSPTALGVSELDGEPFTAHGVIGGGIRSHFLYQLYPDAFPNRGQNAIWACYFLVNRQDYGFPGGSEFLMIEPDGSGTQQNYSYPYDLFNYYAIRLFKTLEEHSLAQDYHLFHRYRYVYLNSFLDHVANVHREDINFLKPQNDELYY